MSNVLYVSVRSPACRHDRTPLDAKTVAPLLEHRCLHPWTLQLRRRPLVSSVQQKRGLNAAQAVILNCEGQCTACAA